MFAELHCKSHYSFLTGSSAPEELIYQAAALGYQALAITDECSYAGIVKAYKASKDCDVKLIVGSEFLLETDAYAIKLVLLAPNRTAYSEVSALITKGRRRSKKGEYRLSTKDLQFGLQHCLAIYVPEHILSITAESQLLIQARALKKYFKRRLWLGVGLFFSSSDQQHYRNCERTARALKINMVACNDVHMHSQQNKPLQDTLTAIRLNTTVQQLGTNRQINAEKYLKPVHVLKHQYPSALLAESTRIANLCDFTMAELSYDYPHEVVPAGAVPSVYLRQLTLEGANRRWPEGVPEKVLQQVDYELTIIAELQYEYYFLTISDIVDFARRQDIYCQGRGSAANSAVCYCLFITEVDPDKSNLLFERFISRERNEPPDIDVDFENSRREEVIQYIYNKYTRKRTALTATVITYRRKSAIRDVGKALGLPQSVIDELLASMAWWDKPETLLERFSDNRFSLSAHLSQLYISLVQKVINKPRHLSQHVGGFLITESPTSTLVPIENAAMQGRTVIQWDKEDIETLGLLKVDVLALGMLTAIHKSIDMINAYTLDQQAYPPLSLATIPREDKAVYDLLCRGDSVGVFQVESRAQMSMLPRLKPRCFYDLVIEVAIVRPGPIQGNMVHPYLKRRNREEKVTYPNEAIKKVLDRTLGVPIFQEQVIQLTMVAAGFSGGEADQLRRAMASWGKNGDLYQFKEKLLNGMLSNGYSGEFADNLFRQMLGFGNYGFPESHSASFAILVYISAWIKCYHPEAFYCGLLNSQPMGFYSPSQLIQDARRHHLTVLPVCVNNSHWDHCLEVIDTDNFHSPAIGHATTRQATTEQKPQLALRLGFRLIKGLAQTAVEALIAARSDRVFNSLLDLKNRVDLRHASLQQIIDAGALHSFYDNRRQASWQALEMATPFATDNRQEGVGKNMDKSPAPYIKPPSAIETLIDDYRSTGLSLNHHPMGLLRTEEPFIRCVTADQLSSCRNKSLVEVAGVVTGRQRPGTNSGVLFMTLEDETGNINVIIWRKLQEYFRSEVLNGKILYIKGTLETRDNVVHVVAGYIENHSAALPAMREKSRDFR